MSGSPWFNWTNNALSDLGAIGISAFFFNNGLILGGIFVFIFSLGLAENLPRKTGAYLLTVSSLALIGIGLFPKTLFLLHYFSSAVFFVLITLALLFIGIAMKRDQIEHSMGSAAIAFAFLAISAPFLLNFFKGIAIPEAIVCFPAFIWCMFYGIKMTLTT